ncbi:MAG: glycoside hydrolase family 28 protein [Opitutae bacterium]|nr:glycoside hydrolase family 28 protein [Opitutae bacterium]
MCLSTFATILCLSGSTLFAAEAGMAASAVQDVRRFGAQPDGTTLNTAAFNAAVAAAAAAGGGTVYVPPGRYLTGTIYLKSDITLHLEAGAVLLGSTDLRDYPENPAPAPADTPEFRRMAHLYPHRLEFGRYSLIYAAGQRNVAVVGRGVIDGQGDHPNFSKQELIARGLTRDQAHFRRPYALGFVRCASVQVRDVTFRNLAFWCEGYLDCEDVLVDGVTVDSRAIDRNNDGIDIDGCRRVRVTNCRFNTGDDAICLKASYRDCEDIVIADSVCSSVCNGIKFGTASNGGFKNIAISNMTMKDIGSAGRAFESVDGGVIDGVVVSNVVMDQVGAALFLRLGDRGSQWMKPEDHVVGAIRNVSIQNVVARVFAIYDGRPLASSITGLPGHPVENVTLSNVRLIIERDYPRSETEPLRTAGIPEPATAYPEYSMFGPLPACLYVRHGRGVTLQGVDVTFLHSDHRSSLVCDDVRDLRVRDWKARTLPDAAPVVRLVDVKGAVLAGASAPEDCGTYLRVDGASAEIVLTGADLDHAREAVSLAPHLPATTVRR